MVSLFDKSQKDGIKTSHVIFANITRNDSQHYTLSFQSLHVMFFDVARGGRNDAISCAAANKFIIRYSLFIIIS